MAKLILLQEVLCMLVICHHNEPIYQQEKYTHKLPSLLCLINKQLDKWEYTELVIIYQNITNWNIYIYIYIYSSIIVDLLQSL